MNLFKLFTALLLLFLVLGALRMAFQYRYVQLQAVKICDNMGAIALPYFDSFDCLRDGNIIASYYCGEDTNYYCVRVR